MNKKKTLLVLVLAFAVLMIGAVLLYDRLGQEIAPEQMATQPPATEVTDETTPSNVVIAPDFTVYDIDGNEVHLSDYLGTPVVINFWASWCVPCKMEMPDFEEMYQKLEGKVQFLMINSTDGSRETVESASAFIEEKGYTFPVFYDTDGNASYTYNATSLPTTFFINAEGHGVAQAVGVISPENLELGISMIYSGE